MALAQEALEMLHRLPALLWERLERPGFLLLALRQVQVEMLVARGQILTSPSLASLVAVAAVVAASVGAAAVVVRRVLVAQAVVSGEFKVLWLEGLRPHFLEPSLLVRSVQVLERVPWEPVQPSLLQPQLPVQERA